MLHRRERIKTLMMILGMFFFLFLLGCQHDSSLSEREYMTDPIYSGQDPTKSNESEDGKETNTNEERDRVGQARTQDGEVARLIFIGDTMMAGKVADVMEERGNDYPLSEFMPILQESDLVIANLETAVGSSGNTLAEVKKYAFQTAPERFQLFEPLREQLVFSLANNHGMDAPLNETMSELDRLGYSYIGVGENSQSAIQPYVQEINGIEIAVLAASRVIPTADWMAGPERAGMASAYSDEPLLSTIEQWKNQVDYVIVYIHWGEELANEPNQIQLELEQKMRGAGADIIIGSHPHVLQAIEWKGKKDLTAFSMGNFVFTTSVNAVANDTAALEIHLSKDQIEHVQLWPGEVQFGLIRYLIDTVERERVFQRIRELSPTITVGPDGRITKSF
ncbi:CapA family protein [Caldalkalibacillus mannanilyticus]|uniref:CapA family protein n=1 Tax=Caldalkalibacillus mannanilyticus TaxID=1418 RepID=UPI00046979D0|nr:CapA family protein [Caldalkalibacillus mannanilyticus]